MKRHDDQISAGALIEYFDGKLDLMAEMFASMYSYMQEHMATKEELAEVKADVKVIKATTKDLSRKINDHEHRITRLEARHF